MRSFKGQELNLANMFSMRDIFLFPNMSVKNAEYFLESMVKE